MPVAEPHVFPYGVAGRSGHHATPVLSMRDKPVVVNLGIGHINFAPSAVIEDQGAPDNPTVCVKCKIVGPGVFQIAGYNKDGASSLMTYGEIASAAGPFSVPVPSSLGLEIDGTPVSRAWVGTLASVQGAGGTFVGLNGTTLGVKVGNAAPVTVTFTFEADAASVAATIQAAVPGTSVSFAAQVRINSSIYGTAARIEITSGNALVGFTTGMVSTGTGDAANMAAMTRQELVTALTSIPGLRAYDTGTVVKISSMTLGGLGSIKVTSGAAPFSFPGATVVGVGVETFVRGFALEGNPATLQG